MPRVTAEDIILGGFGDKLIEGFIKGLLGGFTIPDTYDNLKRDADLKIPIANPARYRSMAKRMGVGRIDTQMVMSVMRKHRPDIASLILNYQNGPNGLNGLKWLDRQVALLKGRLA